MKSPRWVHGLIRLIGARTWSEDVIGDVEEEYRRRLERRGRLVALVLMTRDVAGMLLVFGASRLRSALSGGWLTGSEVRLAFRQVLRTPVMSLTSVLALTVGIALAATGFTVVDAILNPELPFAGGDRFVDIRLTDAEDRTERPLEPGLWSALSTGSTGLSHVGAYRSTQVNVEYGEGTIELLPATDITPATLRYLPYVPVVGRAFMQSDAEAGAPPVALIGEDLWHRRFSRDAGVVGRRISIAGEDVTVVGVLPAAAAFPYRSEVWRPLRGSALDLATGGEGSSASLLGILDAGIDPAAVQDRLSALVAGWSAATGVDPVVPDVRYVGETRGAALPGLVLIAVFIGLLVVVAGNVANLVIARTAARRSELAVRTALGASRTRLVTQLSAEVLLTGIVAAALGLWASNSLLHAVAVGEAEEIPVWIDFGLDFRRAAFAVGLMLVATLVAGVVPALRATRRDFAGALRAAGAGAGGRAFGRFDDAMIVAQIAVSIGVLGAATMLHRGWIGAYGERDPGFRTEDIVSTQLVVLGPRPDGAVPVAQLRTEIEAAIRGLPGVIGVGASTRLPWTDAPLRRVIVEPSSGGGEQATLSVPTVAVGPGLLDLIDATPLAGRLFADPDFRPGAPPVALVNQPFVDESLDGANAVGRRIRFDRPGEEDSPVWYEIVGVVPDRGLSAADPQRAGGVYIPMGDEAEFRLLVRYTGRSAEFIPALQATVFAVDPGIAVSGTGVLSRQLLEIRRVYLVFGSIFTSLGGIVLLLSMMATFAILSFEVTRRTREIGLRVALGADHRSILRLVLGRVVVYMAAGGAIGIVLGQLLLSGARAMLVMRFPPTGLPTFPILIGVMTLAALLAAWLPARRTLSIRPMEALRFD